MSTEANVALAFLRLPYYTVAMAQVDAAERGSQIVNVRVPNEIVARLEVFREAEEARTPGVKVSLASAFRAAVERGLKEIERRRVTP